MSEKAEKEKKEREAQAWNMAVSTFNDPRESHQTLDFGKSQR